MTSCFLIEDLPISSLAPTHDSDSSLGNGYVSAPGSFEESPPDAIRGSFIQRLLDTMVGFGSSTLWRISRPRNRGFPIIGGRSAFRRFHRGLQHERELGQADASARARSTRTKEDG